MNIDKVLTESFGRVKTDIEMLYARMQILSNRQAEVETITQKRLLAQYKEQAQMLKQLQKTVEKQELMIERLRKEISNSQDSRVAKALRA